MWVVDYNRGGGSSDAHMMRTRGEMAKEGRVRQSQEAK